MKIYECHLRDASGAVDHTQQCINPYVGTCNRDRKTPGTGSTNAALLLVCRQFYGEAAKLKWQNHIFPIHLISRQQTHVVESAFGLATQSDQNTSRALRRSYTAKQAHVANLFTPDIPDGRPATSDSRPLHGFTIARNNVGDNHKAPLSIPSTQDGID